MALPMAYAALGCEPVMMEATCHQAGRTKEGANPAGVIIPLFWRR